MGRFLLSVLDWSEIWVLFIPLLVLLFRRKQPVTLKPVIIFLWLALLLNFIIDVIMGFKSYFPSWLQSNNPLYNILAVIRLICFSVFFIQLPHASFASIKKLLFVLAIVLLLINFSGFENFLNPDHLSGNLLAAEAYLLLVYCMLYYLSVLRDDNEDISDSPHFWIVTGLSIYVVINFFVFLFYVPMIYANPKLADNMWNVHNVSFIIFCIFITKAFYGPFRNKHTV